MDTDSNCYSLNSFSVEEICFYEVCLSYGESTLEKISDLVKDSRVKRVNIINAHIHIESKEVLNKSIEFIKNNVLYFLDKLCFSINMVNIKNKDESILFIKNIGRLKDPHADNTGYIILIPNNSDTLNHYYSEIKDKVICGFEIEIEETQKDYNSLYYIILYYM